MDDDLCLTAPDCLELLIQEIEAQYEEGRAVGIHGVITDKSGNYYVTGLRKKLRKSGLKMGPRHFQHPEKNMFVDILKGRLIFMKKKDLAKVPLYPSETEHFMYCDDIIVSSYLASRKRKHHLLTSKLNGKVEEMWGGKEEMALSSSTNWVELRNNIAKIYFTS